jgi:hypothetical protein
LSRSETSGNTSAVTSDQKFAGIFSDWNHPREIVHLTSADGVKWDSLGKVDLKSDRTIDACVMQVPGGGWRMWYKDERARRTLSYADSADLVTWEPKGSCVTNYNGEGPKVLHWKGKYWPLTVADGQLTPGDPAQPTYLDLKSEREPER